MGSPLPPPTALRKAWAPRDTTLVPPPHSPLLHARFHTSEWYPGLGRRISTAAQKVQMGFHPVQVLAGAGQSRVGITLGKPGGPAGIYSQL